MTADEFRLWRMRLKLSQAAAAAALGVSRRTVVYYESGAEVPVAIALACEALQRRAEDGDF